MAEKQPLMPHQQRKKAAETEWLSYFNQVLFDQNIITENVRNQMANKIISRKSPAVIPASKERNF